MSAITALAACANDSTPLLAADRTPPRAATSSPAPTPSASSAPRRAEPVPLEDRVHALAGRTLVVPMVPADVTAETDDSRRRELAAAPWLPSRPPEVTLTNGRVLSAQYVFAVSGPNDAGAPGWLPPTGAWREVSFDDAQRSVALTAAGERGVWLLSIELPKEAHDRIINLNGSALTIVWHDAPPAATDAARLPPIESSEPARRALGEMLRPLAADPLERWRVRLLLDRVRAAALWGDAPPPGRLSTSTLEAAASQTEWRWRAALDRLSRDDPALASDVLAAVTGVVPLPAWGDVMGGAFELAGPAALIPVWWPDIAGTTGLLRTLLDSGLNGAALLENTRARLAKVPRLAAWVIDETGDVAGRTDRSKITSVVAERFGRDAAVTLSDEGDQPGPPTKLVGHRAGIVRAEAAAIPGAARQLVLRDGVSEWRLAVANAPIAARPPGLALGPLAAEWNIISSARGETLVPTSERACSGVLQRSAADDAWELALECRWPAESTNNDALRVWLGPFGSPIGALDINPDAGVRNALEKGAPAPGSVWREPGGWRALVPIPATAIENGRVRLALERTDPRGLRTSWPRAMMPGQSEPGRVIVDLTQWGGLGE